MPPPNRGKEKKPSSQAEKSPSAEVKNQKKRPKNEISADTLKGFKYFPLLLDLLDSLAQHRDERDKAGNRVLFYDQYVLLLLLAMFNPAITSLKGIQQASELDKVKKLLGVNRTSVGALSSAGALFDADLMRDVVRELAKTIDQVPGTTRLGPVEQELLKGLTAVDGTLIRAVPRMVWALWVNDKNRAAKMHLQFEVFKSAPSDATVTVAGSSESAELRANLQAGRLYVTDRGYYDLALFRAILDAKSSFIARIRESAGLTGITELKVSQAARDAGVVRDIIVEKLGTYSEDIVGRPLRVVFLEVTDRDEEKSTFLLATDRLDLPAELVAQAYSYRWSIELYFRWFKCTLGSRHLFAESQNGVEIQAYATLLASLLIVAWTGLEPTKRTWEMIQFYFMGWATLEELERHLDKRRAEAAKPKVKKKTSEKTAR